MSGLLIALVVLCWGGAITGWAIASAARYSQDRSGVITGLIMGNTFTILAFACLFFLYLGLR